jgi:hypothetical protein
VGISKGAVFKIESFLQLIFIFGFLRARLEGIVSLVISFIGCEIFGGRFRGIALLFL